MGGGAPRKKWSQPLETAVRISIGAAMFGDLEADQDALHGSSSERLVRVSLPRRGRRCSKGQGQWLIQERTSYAGGPSSASGCSEPSSTIQKDYRLDRRGRSMTKRQVKPCERRVFSLSFIVVGLRGEQNGEHRLLLHCTKLGIPPCTSQTEVVNPSRRMEGFATTLFMTMHLAACAVATIVGQQLESYAKPAGVILVQ